jgi:hypothetical protein
MYRRVLFFGDRRRKGWLLILGVAMTLALVAGVWFAIGRGKAQHALATKRLSATQVWAQIAEKGRRESRSADLRDWPFAAVAHPLRGMPDRLRKEAKEVLGNPEHLGLLFDSARYATTPDGMGLWVVSGRDVICMVRAANAAVACNTMARAYRQGLLLEVSKLDKAHGRRPTKFTVLGIAPDGVKSIAAQVGKRRRRIAVIHNAFSAEARTPINVVLPSG